MIRTVEFRNFKTLRHVKLDLERFTVLVGPSASGKTSILEGLSYVTHPCPLQLFQQNLSLPLLTRGEEAALEIVLETTKDNRKIILSPLREVERCDDSGRILEHGRRKVGRRATVGGGWLRRDL